MPNSQAPELLACPNVLCDLSRPFLNETDADLDATHTWVSCENCGARGPRIENPSQYYGRTEEWEAVKAEAIAAWNTRAALASTASPADDVLREAAVKLALAAGKLNVALDGQEKYRRHRTAVVEAMNAVSAALSSAVPTMTDTPSSGETA